ncbi:MAG: hypothetical protein JWM92_441 [Candidatus Nomurabacteria bacterium]|nr:hypothetical protein [Candidatus Nomurabacteria bacterium]
MKKLILLCVVGFIVNTCLSTVAKAQYGHRVMGYGYFKSAYQKCNDAKAEEHFKKAMIALFSHEDKTAMIYLREDIGLICDDYRQIIANGVADQSGYQVPDDATMVDLYQNHLEFLTVYADHWESHTSTYLQKNSTDPVTFNPTTSNIYHRDHWRIARLHMPNNGISDQITYCANLAPPIAGIAPVYNGPETGYQRSGLAANTTVEQKSSSVVYRKQTTQWDEEHANNNLKKCNTGRTLLIVGAAIVVATVAYLLLKPKDHSYSNGWVHDSNTSPWPAGSGGSGNGPSY